MNKLYYTFCFLFLIIVSSLSAERNPDSGLTDYKESSYFSAGLGYFYVHGSENFIKGVRIDPTGFLRSSGDLSYFMKPMPTVNFRLFGKGEGPFNSELFKETEHGCCALYVVGGIGTGVNDESSLSYLFGLGIGSQTTDGGHFTFVIGLYYDSTVRRLLPNPLIQIDRPFLYDPILISAYESRDLAAITARAGELQVGEEFLNKVTGSVNATYFAIGITTSFRFP